MLTYPGNVVVENHFHYEYTGGNKTITLYDTSLVDQFGGYRPLISTFTFDAKNRLINSFEKSTRHNSIPNSWYRDTDMIAITYDNNDHIAKVTEYSAAYDPAGIYFESDTLTFTRENGRPELYNTYNTILKTCIGSKLQKPV